MTDLDKRSWEGCEKQHPDRIKEWDKQQALNKAQEKARAQKTPAKKGQGFWDYFDDQLT